MAAAALTRRSFVKQAATAVVLSAVPTVAVAKFYGVDDAPDEAQKFSGAGWYTFGHGDGSGMRVMYAEPDRKGFCPGFIDLSDGPDMKVRWSFSAHIFDQICWGKCSPAV